MTAKRLGPFLTLRRAPAATHSLFSAMAGSVWAASRVAGLAEGGDRRSGVACSIFAAGRSSRTVPPTSDAIGRRL